MKSLSRVVIWIAGSIIGLVVILFGGFLLFSVIHEYRPDPIESVEVDGSSSEKSDTTRVFSLIIWNIGYGGLGKEMDFFYDGGKNVRPEEPYFERSIAGIGSFITQHDSVDFFLLQEVDMDSKRSYYLDEVGWLQPLLPGFCFSFASNYNCRFVPVPVMNPMGRVVSGLVSCSRYLPEKVTRYGFDTHEPWPNRLFYLKRCFMASRFTLADGNQLVVVNIHNSAFDTGCILRKREMEMIRSFMVAEYNDGNYLVAGGDWNANPSGFEQGRIITGDKVKQDEFCDLKTFFPDWEFAFDHQYPTNRDVDSAYLKGTTPVTTIDFFLVSPNIRILQVQTFPTGFEDSDHQPVYLQISLSPSL